MSESSEKQNYLVVGLARSGIAVAEMLASLGARVVLSDLRNDIEVSRLETLGCEARLGEAAETLLEGMDAVVVSPAVPMTAPVIREADRLGIEVLAELEVAARHAEGLQVAITGTNGKTTTTMLVGEMLKNAGKRTYVAGNIGVPLSSVALKTAREDYIVIEVSSFQLEHMPTFHPRVGAILNLTPDHLNRHGTMEAYGALKEGMLRHMNDGDRFIYNADDPFCREAAGRTKAKAVPFSRKQALTEGAWMENGQLMIRERAILKAEEMSLPGPHNLENALAAAAMAVELGVPAPVIRHTLRSFQGVEHRMEHVRTLGGVRYINDSKGTNPESSMRAVQGMTAPTVLIAGGDDKGTGFAALAQAVRENAYIQRVLLIGRAAERICAALEEEGYAEYTIIGYDFEKAIREAKALAVEGGTVLFSPACASFDMFTDYEARGRLFKEIVNKLS